MKILKSDFHGDINDPAFLLELHAPEPIGTRIVYTVLYCIAAFLFLASGLWLVWIAWAGIHPKSWNKLFGRYFFLEY